MSYCVRCGVELSSGAKKCVLCDTPVVISEEIKSSVKPPYPERLMIPPSVRKRYAAFLIGIILLIPNLVCLLINILMPETGLWSVYVISSSVFFFLVAVVPLMINKPHPFLLLFIDTVGAMMYAYVFFYMYRENGWYFKLAFPFILIFSLFCFIFIAWLRKRKRGKLQIIIILLADLAAFSLIVDALVNRYYENEHLFFVSVIISVSCICLMLFFRATEKNRRFKAWMTRRFYF
ncbi:MAG: hypothetical protein BWY46_01793 [Firmicutes bacterium ADurb.Bin300]|nr:MAG: hypothetical protein BWY46_01793 [Firmicutes bacterium ADurb.Bin300]HOD01896.1 DUF6320 domain-containing protein [Clostridiales bacterium]